MIKQTLEKMTECIKHLSKDYSLLYEQDYRLSFCLSPSARKSDYLSTMKRIN